MKTLVVDDDLTCRLLLQEILKSYGPVDTAANGREALRAVALALSRKDPYNLITLDVMMPEMDGFTALKEIRAQEETRWISSSQGAKIIMTTTRDERQDVSTAFGLLCDGYLTKPVNIRTLRQELANLGLIDEF